jgi:c-di-GMP-binding flagellar brake protein YcgR
MGWDGKERRRKKRYGIRNSTVRYKKAGLFSMFAPLSAKYLLLNFSEGGVHFISKDPLEPGTAIDLELEAPKIRGAVSVRGKVVWTRKSEQLDAHHVGVEFGSMSGRAKEVLKFMLDGALLDNVDISTKAYMKEIEKL